MKFNHERKAMAKLTIVATVDGEGYYVTDGETESDSADWGVPVDFNEVRYFGETDGDEATLSIITEMAEGSYDAEDEDDDGAEVAAAT